MAFDYDELMILFGWVGGSIETEDATRALGITRVELCQYEMSALNEAREVARALLAEMPPVERIEVIGKGAAA